MLDPRAATNAGKKLWLFVLQLGRDQNCDRFAHGLSCRIAEQALCAGIPAHDGSVDVHADDGIIRRFDDARELPPRRRAGVKLGDIEQRCDPAADISLLVTLGPIGDMQGARAGVRNVSSHSKSTAWPRSTFSV